MFNINGNGHILRRIFYLFKPYSKKIAVIIICTILSSGLGMLYPLISKHLTDDGLLKGRMDIVVRLTLFSFLLILADQGLGLLETRFRAYLSAKIPYDLSKSAFKHLLKMKITYFNNINFAEIMSNIGMDVSNIARISDRSTFFIIMQVFRILGGIIGLVLIDWKLTLLVVAMIPFRYGIVKYLAGKRRKSFEQLMEYSREYSSWYGDTIGGMKEIKLWGLDRIKTGEFIRKQKNILKVNVNLAFIDKLNEISETVLFDIISNSLYILGAFMVVGSSLTVGGLFAFITYSVYVTAPISAILNIGYSFTNIIPSAKRLFAFLDMEGEGAGIRGKTYRLDARDIRGSIRFENVSFSYRQGEAVLKNVSFEIRNGEKIAIIGANGSGKSTVINLLLRFMKPESGRILIDETNINEVNLRDYRKLISVVNQELYLFDTTIKENISMFSRNKDLNIYKAAQKSGAHGFIEAMPGKYECVVGRNGSKLSGGERQKIAVARAFARNCRLLVLDEATSNYDYKSVLTVNELLGKDFKDKTVIIVTHEPDILKQVDRIIVLEKGIVKAIGSHDELVAKKELHLNLISRNEKVICENVN